MKRLPGGYLCGKRTSSFFFRCPIHLGQFLPPRLHFLPQSVLQSILDRNAEFTRCEQLKIFIGTWNVNGGRNVRSLAHRDNDLSDWLLAGRQHYTGYRNPYADSEAFTRPTDIFAVGFEEIIDLNASNVVANKQRSENQRYWGATLQTLFDQASETGEPYVLLCTTQLVGVCIFVFLRFGLCGYVRGLASASVKTGLHAKAGNKGAVAVRFQVCSLIPYFALLSRLNLFFFMLNINSLAYTPLILTESYSLLPQACLS